MAQNENLCMQRDKHLRIVDYRKRDDGKDLYRVQWGSPGASKVWYTWCTSEDLPLAQDTIDEWWKGGSCAPEAPSGFGSLGSFGSFGSLGSLGSFGFFLV